MSKKIKIRSFLLLAADSFNKTTGIVQAQINR